MSTNSPIIEDLHIEASTQTYFVPEVKFDGSTGHCTISGESYLEDTFEFYDKLMDWHARFFEAGGEQITLDIKLTYFNTSSSRALLDLLKRLKAHQDEGKVVVVNWHYPNPDDDEMLMEAEDFMEESKLEMNLVEYPLEED